MGRANRPPPAPASIMVSSGDIYDAHALIFHWFYVVTVVYGNAPPLAGVLAPLVPGAYVAAFAGIFGMGWAVLGRLGGFVAGPSMTRWPSCSFTERCICWDTITHGAGTRR